MRSATQRGAPLLGHSSLIRPPPHGSRASPVAQCRHCSPRAGRRRLASRSTSRGFASFCDLASLLFVCAIYIKQRDTNNGCSASGNPRHATAPRDNINTQQFTRCPHKYTRTYASTELLSPLGALRNPGCIHDLQAAGARRPQTGPLDTRSTVPIAIPHERSAKRLPCSAQECPCTPGAVCSPSCTPDQPPHTSSSPVAQPYARVPKACTHLAMVADARETGSDM